MEGTIRVTPEKLISAASSFADSANKIQELTSNMLTTIDSLNSTYTGEAATAYYNKAHALQDSINKMVSMVTEHSNDLQEMGTQYQNAEQAAQEQANQLQTDIIE